MELQHYARVVRRWLWLVFLFGLIAAATAGAVSYQTPKVFQATTVALVNPTQQVVPNAQGTTDTDTLLGTYVRLVAVAPVRDALARAGDITREEAAALKINAVREPATTLVDINIQSADPNVAFRAAQGVVTAFNSSLDQLQQEIQGASPGARLQAMVPVNIPVSAPSRPVSPQPVRDALIALVVGLVLGVSLAFLLEYLDNTVKTDYDVRLKLNMPLLGSVVFQPQYGRSGGEIALSLLSINEPTDPMSEAYRAIRTKLQFNGLDKPIRSIVVTSTIPGEGKTISACNIASALAQAGSRVILVDADLRRPEMHMVFQLENRGLGNLILMDRPESELIQPTALDNLRVVCSGPTPSNPSELLGSTRMAAVAQRLGELADVVIYDTPPVGAVTDGTVLAAHADATILIVEQGRASIGQVAHSRDTLQNVGARLVGVILNKLPTSEATDYYAQYYGPDVAGNRDKTPPGGRRKSDKADAGRRREAAETLADH